MLNWLHIKNIALIEELTIQIPVGFSVLSGETGAGKSIIIGALNFVLGERASHDILRTGAAKAFVEGSFSVEPFSDSFRSVLEPLGIDQDEDLILSRELTASGKNTCRINGTAVSMQVLKCVGDMLVDIHGQHEHQRLLAPENHLKFLDGFAYQQLAPMLQETAVLAASVTDARARLRSVALSQRERAQKIDLYSYQVAEIDAAALSETEEESLLQEKKLLQHARVILDAVSTVSGLLEGEEGVLEKLSGAKRALDPISGLDVTYADLARQLEEYYYAIQETGFAASKIAGSVSFEPDRLEQIEERLILIGELKRKYGDSVQDILAYRERIHQELSMLIRTEEDKGSLEDAYRASYREYRASAKALGEKRRECARRLEERLIGQLEDLGMPGVCFQVAFSEMPKDVFSPDGIDAVEFLLSANKGEDLKPLSKVASGGELSRIMLAFKCLNTESGPVQTMIFDEIDTGISGQVANAVAAKMRQISKERQVICITHLPQIAACADSHFLVEKQVIGDRTVSGVRMLSLEERAMEVARIMGSDKDDETAVSHARTMIGIGKA